MIEYFTRAVVLDKEETGEWDMEVCFFTEELGRVEARAIGARKILSKLAAHLEPNRITAVRLVEKNGFIVADAVMEKKINLSFKELKLLKEGTTPLGRDDALWDKILKGELGVKWLLKHFGFDPKFAACQFCGERENLYFYFSGQEFSCGRCAANLGLDKEEMTEI